MVFESLEILWNYRQGFAAGLFVTMKLAAFIWVVGIVFGILWGTIANQFPTLIGVLTRCCAAIFTAIPAIVLLFWAYFPLQMLLQVDIDPFWTAAGVFTSLNAITTAELIRSLLNDFPQQYRDAAKVCGVSPSTTFWRIELPLVLRQAIPTILVLQITMLHLTLFASLISVEDVFRVAQRINSSIYRPVEVYSALAVTFVAICIPVQLIANWAQKRVAATMREQ